MRKLKENSRAEAEILMILGVVGGIILSSFLWIGILILAAICGYYVYKNTSDNQHKFLWTVFALILPIIGLLVWKFLGPGKQVSFVEEVKGYSVKM